MKIQFCFYFIILTSACIMHNSAKKLIDINKNIEKNIISEFCKSSDCVENKEKNVIVVKIKKQVSEYMIRVSILDKDEFRWYLPYVKKDELFGYTYYNGVLVLVYGNKCETFYKRTAKAKEIKFLKFDKKTSYNSNKLEPIPIIIEPEVWLYSFNGNNFILKEKGMLDLLE